MKQKAAIKIVIDMIMTLSKILFYIDYLAVMGLCIFIAYDLSRLCIQGICTILQQKGLKI